ncbi:hypothetical protein LOTGIDRAFT_236780 [Lottia gigantea]|uniref:ZBR-type domain-containing protein n=1 Tax=Lottia gigantea TaxID=225164 RepID=V3YYG2_LOTGI|nr:hypothetical protein LOTGIDRAFT_236780 [Lottia gigantea]ESO83183.1 hypothetical protein LOTGIDRAFT_236780 [Lottia gigantea]
MIMAEAGYLDPDSAREFAREVEKMRSISTSTPMAITSLCSSVFSEADSGFEDVTVDSCFLTTTTASSNYSFDSDSNFSFNSKSLSGHGLFYSPILKEQPSPKQPEKEHNLRDWEIPEEEDIFLKINNRNLTDLPCRNLSFEFDSQDSGLQTSSSSPSIELSARFQQVLSTFSPSVLDRLIGRKMGLEKVDIVSELSARNVMALSSIFSYLEPQDLCSMCQVSQNWRKVVHSDARASKLKKKYVKYSQETSLGKENSSKSLRYRSIRGLTQANKFETIQLTQHQRASTPYSKLSTGDIFSMAADSLREGEELRKCPKCFGASRVLPGYDRGTCFNSDCSFEFCSKCFCEYHGSKSCNPIGVCKKQKKDIIGSKKAKKNLKRLSAL